MNLEVDTRAEDTDRVDQKRQSQVAPQKQIPNAVEKIYRTTEPPYLAILQSQNCCLQNVLTTRPWQQRFCELSESPHTVPIESMKTKCTDERSCSFIQDPKQCNDFVQGITHPK